MCLQVYEVDNFADNFLKVLMKTTPITVAVNEVGGNGFSIF